MEFLLLFCPAIFSLTIAEYFLPEVKGAGAWFKIKYIAILSLLTNLFGCAAIWFIQKDNFHFNFAQYPPKTIIIFTALYLAIAIALTFFMIAINHFVAFKLERHSNREKS